MKHGIALPGVVLCAAILACGTLSAQQPATSDVPKIISYQGMITSSDGQPPADGEYPVTVKLYMDEAGIRPIWHDTYTTRLSGGIFSIYLGSGAAPLPGSEEMNRPLWIGTQIAGGEELRPLTRLSASPYALNVADDVITTDKLADGAVTASKTDMDYLAGISIDGKKIGGKGTVLSIQGERGVDVRYDDVAQSIVIGIPVTAQRDKEEDRELQGTAQDGWSMRGNGVSVPGAAPVAPVAGDYIGTNNFVDFDIRVNGIQAMKYQPTTSGATTTPNIIGGDATNSIPVSISAGNIIASGEQNIIFGTLYNTISGGSFNSILDEESEHSVIGGGKENTIEASVFSTIAGGTQHEINGSPSLFMANHSTIGGGRLNRIYATVSTIAGGGENEIQPPGSYSVIGGGRGNYIWNLYGSISGGETNLVLGDHGTISGGYSNVAGSLGSVGGGMSNEVAGAYGTIGGGGSHVVAGEYGFIGGGYDNSVREDYSTISGGNNNIIFGKYSSIGGGADNIVEEDYSTISGGRSNESSGPYSSVLGGWGNVASGDVAMIGGGDNNSADGDVAVIAGGSRNEILSNSAAAIGGGEGNMIDDGADYSFIGSGLENQILGSGSWHGVAAAIPSGDNLIAQSYGQTVLGVFNEPKGSIPFRYNGTGPNDEPILIVGNGTTSGRSNAFEVSYNGHSTVFHTNGSGAPAIHGATYTDNITYAWGDIDPNGNPHDYFGIQSISHLGPGWYQITMDIVDPNGNPVTLQTAAITATISTNSPPVNGLNGRCRHITTTRLGNSNNFDIYITESYFDPRQGTNKCDYVDEGFMFKVTGRP